jgi:serine/threonine protein kinase
MHKCGMCHLDVKPDNILLAAPLSFGVAPQFKLADFGLTVPLYGADSPLERGELHAEGDRKFCSREIMSGRLSAETLMSADIFALGLTIYALARGSQFGPLPDDGPQWEQLRYGVLPTLPRSPDKQSTLLQDDSVLMNVIQSMIQPEQRPTASELVFYLTAHFNEPTPTGDVITPSESKTLDLLSPTPNTSQPSVRMDEQSVSKQNLFKQQPSPIPCSPFLSPGAVPFSVQKSTVTPTPFQSQTLNYVSPGNVSTPAHNVTADWWVAEIAQLKAQLMAQQVETQRLEAIVLSI